MLNQRLSTETLGLHGSIKIDPFKIIGLHKALVNQPKRYMDKIYNDFCKFARQSLKVTSLSRGLTRFVSRSFVVELFAEYAKALRGEYGDEDREEVRKLVMTWATQCLATPNLRIIEVHGVAKMLFGYSFTEEENQFFLDTLTGLSPNGGALGELLRVFCESPYELYQGCDVESAVFGFASKMSNTSILDISSLIKFTAQSPEMGAARCLWIKGCLESESHKFSSFKKFASYYKTMWGVALTNNESNYGFTLYSQLKKSLLKDKVSEGDGIISSEGDGSTSDEGDGIISGEGEVISGGEGDGIISSGEGDVISSGEGEVISGGEGEVDFGLLRVRFCGGGKVEIGRLEATRLDVRGVVGVSIGEVSGGMLMGVRLG